MGVPAQLPYRALYQEIHSQAGFAVPDTCRWKTRQTVNTREGSCPELIIALCLAHLCARVVVFLCPDL